MSQKPQKTAALPALWYKAVVKKQADLERIRLAVLQQVREALSSLERKFHWDEAYLFGSLVQKGRFRRNSDIDIAVKGLSKFDHYQFISEITDLLDKRVDVVLLEECHFTDSIKEKGIKWNPKSKS